MGRKREIETLHVYFHVDEIAELRRIGAANGQESVRSVVRMIVRDFLISAHRAGNVTLNQPAVTWTVTTAP